MTQKDYRKIDKVIRLLRIYQVIRVFDGQILTAIP